MEELHSNRKKTEASRKKLQFLRIREIGIHNITKNSKSTNSEKNSIELLNGNSIKTIKHRTNAP